MSDDTPNATNVTMRNPVSQLPPNDALLVAWDKYKRTESFDNTKKWAADASHIDGSLWAAFMHGYTAALRDAAALHESINSSSDQERFNGDPGAGAMGAIIEYRDAIRRITEAVT